MKFRVTRTKIWELGENDPPIEGCVGQHGHIAFMLGGELVKKEREDWYIELNTLDDLLAFHKRAKNDLILTIDSFYGDGYTLEIYDGYRE